MPLWDVPGPGPPRAAAGAGSHVSLDGLLAVLLRRLSGRDRQPVRVWSCLRGGLPRCPGSPGPSGFRLVLNILNATTVLQERVTRGCGTKQVISCSGSSAPSVLWVRAVLPVGCSLVELSIEMPGSPPLGARPRRCPQFLWPAPSLSTLIQFFNLIFYFIRCPISF